MYGIENVHAQITALYWSVPVVYSNKLRVVKSIVYTIQNVLQIVPCILYFTSILGVFQEYNKLNSPSWIITSNAGEEQSAVRLIEGDFDWREGHLHEDEYRVADINAQWLCDGDGQVVVRVRDARRRGGALAAAVRQVRVRDAEPIAN